MYKPLSIAVVTILSFSSCKKNEKLPASGGDKLDKIIVRSASNGQETGRVTFTYNSQNLLVQKTDVNAGTTSHDSFEYDVSGRLLKHTHDNTAAGVISYYTFQTDASNRISKAIGTPVLPGLIVSDYSFAYDSQGRIIADSSFDSGLLMSYNVYAYDSKGNVITTEMLSRTSIGMESQGVYTIQYDDKINPYRMTGNPLLYSNPGSPEVLSRNNIISRSPDGGTIPLQYEYYSNGQVRKIKGQGLAWESEFYYK